MRQETLLNTLRENGHRITQVRKYMLHMFSTAQSPLAVSEISSQLRRLGAIPNKTTLYREIEFLLNQNIIQQINFNKTNKYYELKSAHHHHVVCTRCGAVAEVSLKELESMLPTIETGLRRKTGFKRIDHSLEFFGVCQMCA